MTWFWRFDREVKTFLQMVQMCCCLFCLCCTLTWLLSSFFEARTFPQKHLNCCVDVDRQDFRWASRWVNFWNFSLHEMHMKERWMSERWDEDASGRCFGFSCTSSMTMVLETFGAENGLISFVDVFSGEILRNLMFVYFLVMSSARVRLLSITTGVNWISGRLPLCILRIFCISRMLSMLNTSVFIIG